MNLRLQLYPRRLQTQFAIASLLGWLHWLYCPLPVLSLPGASIVLDSPVILSQTPRTPPPKGRRRPGGSLTGGQQTCNRQTKQTLTALTPLNAQGLTQSEHPTLWFFIPYTSAEVRSGEFSLLTQDETRVVYQAAFTLPQTPGLVSIRLPRSPAITLEAGNYYHWYLNLYCASNTSARPDLDMDGWIQRVKATGQYHQSTAWYDQVNDLAERLQTEPQNPTLRKRWTELLESVDLAELAKEPIIGPVLMKEPPPQ